MLKYVSPKSWKRLDSNLAKLWPTVCSNTNT
jgi:hypothetical protein